jgi:flagellar biosynthetic protein FlhB
MAPKWDKIDPLRGFQRLFSMKAFVELVKNTLKIVIVGMVAYLAVRDEVSDLPGLMDRDAWQILVYIGGISFRIMFTTCWVLIILAILDYGYQRWEYEKGLRMSRQDIKEEYKHTEGDPIVKARIKRMQREAARKRMMAAVPKATVVITNPTHLAVALAYDQERMIAPTVVAKGAGYVAAKIKEVALAHGVPIIESKPVAQLLYKMVDIDACVPENLYRAVAEILAFVYRLRQDRRW